jgi:hypothetical protein
VVPLENWLLRGERPPRGEERRCPPISAPIFALFIPYAKKSATSLLKRTSWWQIEEVGTVSATPWGSNPDTTRDTRPCELFLK